MAIEDLYIFGVTKNGRLLYTSPTTGSPPWNPWQEVKIPDAFISIASAITQSPSTRMVHLCGITKKGRLWYSFQTATTDWQPFEDITDRIGIAQGKPQSVTATGESELVLCIATRMHDDKKHILQTTRHDNGSWDTCVDVTSPQLAGQPGSFVQASCSFVQAEVTGAIGELDVSGITDDGRLWHTVHLDTFAWVPFVNVQKLATGAPGKFADVSICGGNDLNIFAQSGGEIWHTIRIPSDNAVWQPTFDNINEQAGHPGSFGPIACANLGNRIELCGITPENGKLWRTMRSLSTSSPGWQQFDDLSQLPGSPDAFVLVYLAYMVTWPALQDLSDPRCRKCNAQISTDRRWIQQLQMTGVGSTDPRITGLEQDIARNQGIMRAIPC